MRWRKAQDGDVRTITTFLLLPRLIEGEWRWLEWATIKQEYTWERAGGCRVIYLWHDVCWVNT